MNAELARLLREGRWVQPTSAAGVLGIGAAAFLLSYDALHSLALASGVRPGLARIWPGVLDGFIVVATLTVVAAKRASRSTWYPWALVGLFSAASVAFNILHAVDQALTPAGWVAALVFAMPPVALVLATHLLLQQGVWRRQHTGTAAAMGERSDRGRDTADARRIDKSRSGGARQPELRQQPWERPVGCRLLRPSDNQGMRPPGTVPDSSMSKPKRLAANSPAPILAGPLAPATATDGCCCASSAPAPRPLTTAPQGRPDAANQPAGRGRGGLREPRLSRAPATPSPSREPHPVAKDVLLVWRPGLWNSRQASPDPTRPAGRHQ